MANEWTKPEHALDYLERLETIPHRREGEATLLAEVPESAKRILDLGCGNGHLLGLLIAHCPDAMNRGPEDDDPSNQLLDVETQLRWLRDIGFEDVDCYWKWRELALLAGRKTARPA